MEKKKILTLSFERKESRRRSDEDDVLGLGGERKNSQEKRHVQGKEEEMKMTFED